MVACALCRQEHSTYLTCNEALDRARMRVNEANMARAREIEYDEMRRRDGVMVCSVCRHPHSHSVPCGAAQVERERATAVLRAFDASVWAQAGPEIARRVLAMDRLEATLTQMARAERLR